MDIQTIKDLQEFVSRCFQLERLEELSKTNFIIAIAYAELIAHVNNVFLNTRESISIEGEADTPVVGTMGFDIEAKLDACAKAFRRMAHMLDQALSIDALQNLGMTMGTATDIAKSVLSSSKVQMYNFPELPELPRKKG